MYFRPCERSFKKIHPGANLLQLGRWCKSFSTRVANIIWSHVYNVLSSGLILMDFAFFMLFKIIIRINNENNFGLLATLPPKMYNITNLFI